MTKAAEIENRIHTKFGRHAGFVANVILVQYSNPTLKLRGLWNLLSAGHDVSFVPETILDLRG